MKPNMKIFDSMQKIFTLLISFVIVFVVACTVDNGESNTDIKKPEPPVTEEEEDTPDTEQPQPGDKFITCYINGKENGGYMEFEIDKGGEFEVRTGQKTYLGFVGTGDETGLYQYYYYDTTSGTTPPEEYSNEYISISQTGSDTYKITVSPLPDLDYIYAQIHFMPLEDMSYCFGQVTVSSKR